MGDLLDRTGEKDLSLGRRHRASAERSSWPGSKRWLKSILICLVILLNGLLVYQLAQANIDGKRATTLTTTPLPGSSSAPVLTGWGGIQLNEAGTDMEAHIQLFQSLGYNAIRVSFESPCSSPQQEGPYSASQLQTAISLAQKYNFWIIIDMHGYYDIYPTFQSCWLSNWKPIVQQFLSSYSRIMWEPENEPQSSYYGDPEGVSLAQLSSGYQAWINQARSIGDNHWIVVANGCISTCESSTNVAASMWPTVNDTAGHVFIDWHFYMYYPYWSTQGTGWNNATAELAATGYYNLLESGMQATGWPAINTEGGADYIGGCPPDVILGPCNPSSGTGLGTCDGYTLTTLHFVQKLITLYNSAKISWIGWPAGSWSTNVCNPPSGVSYGALQPASGLFPGGWATKLTPASPDFTIYASASSGVNAGQSAPVTITVTGRNGFTGIVSLAASLASGLTCGSITPSSLTGSGTATVSCNTNTAGTFTLTVTGTSGSLTHSTTVILEFRDFAITATSPASVPPGSSAQSTITINPLNGFAGTILLTDNTPSGLTCGVVTPSSITASGVATLSCSSTAQKVYTVTITSTSGSLTHTAAASFTFGTPPDFIITASSPGVVDVGSSTTSTITVTLIHGFTGTITLTGTLPSGLSCGPITSTNISNNSTTVISCSSATASTYVLIMTGTSGSLTHSTTITFTFVDFGISASPLTLTLNSGISGNSTVTITPVNGFMGRVTLTATASSGLSAMLSTGTISGSGTATLAVSAASPGTYSVVITATSGVLTRMTVVTVDITAHILPVILVPGPQNATVGTSLQFTVSASDSSGTGGTVVLSATGLVANMAFDPTTGAFSFTPSSSQAGQVFVVNFTATDGNDPSWATTETVPIHVAATVSQPSPGGVCLTCLVPKEFSESVWLLVLGALIGVVSSVALHTIKAQAEFAGARRRLRSYQNMELFQRKGN